MIIQYFKIIGRYQNTSFEHLGPAAREDTLATAKGNDESRTIHIFSVRNSEGSKNATIEQDIGCFAWKLWMQYLFAHPISKQRKKNTSWEFILLHPRPTSPMMLLFSPRNIMNALQPSRSSKYIKISRSSSSVKGFHPSLRNQAHVFGIATAFVRYDHGVNAKRSIWTICWPKPLQRAQSNVKLWMCTDCLICLSLLIFLALRSFWFVNFIGCLAIFRHTTYRIDP